MASMLGVGASPLVGEEELPGAEGASVGAEGAVEKVGIDRLWLDDGKVLLGAVRGESCAPFSSRNVHSS